VVVEAEVKEEQGRTLFGVNREVRSKKDLTGPTLLEKAGAGLWLSVGRNPRVPKNPQQGCRNRRWRIEREGA
jgi:hypothetical protein